MERRKTEDIYGKERRHTEEKNTEKKPTKRGYTGKRNTKKGNMERRYKGRKNIRERENYKEKTYGKKKKSTKYTEKELI